MHVPPWVPPLRCMPLKTESPAACSSPNTLRHAMTVCSPRRAPPRSLRTSGDSLLPGVSLGAPSESLAGLAMPLGIAAIASVVACSPPLGSLPRAGFLPLRHACVS